jgi:hypothetical protein
MVFAQKYIDSRIIPDEALANFRKLAVTAVMDASPAFGAWLRGWCETEELWRTKDPDNRPVKHVVALPPVHTWDDQEVGKALRASTSLSFIELHGSFDQFVDRIALCISEAAAERLAKHE